MKVSIELNQLQQMLNTASELGASRSLQKAGLDKSDISKNEAYRRYSRKRVDRWIEEGKIVPVKFGSAIKLNLAELEVLAKTNELYSKHLVR